MEGEGRETNIQQVIITWWAQDLGWEVMAKLHPAGLMTWRAGQGWHGGKMFQVEETG